jgi:hypothetical protein
MRRGCLPWAALAAAALWMSTPASAQDNDRISQARKLAIESADLIDQHNYAAALERATKAESLYHAPIHLQLAGQALEGLGRRAEAVTLYERLVAEPLPASAPAVFRNAQEAGKKRLRELLASVPSMLVVIHGAPSDEVKVAVDGNPIPVGSGVAKRFDPGKHAVRVTATGYKTLEKEVTLPDRGGVTTIELTLELEGAQPGPSTTTDARPSASSPGATQPDVAIPSAGSKVPAWIAFGAGGVGLVVGITTGALSWSKTSALKDRCEGGHCSSADQSDYDGAHTLATVSNIGFGVAAAGAVTGVVLLFTRTPARAATTQAAWHPWIGPGSAGVEGRF